MTAVGEGKQGQAVPAASRLPAWSRRPAAPIAALLLAAVVSLLHGQPSPVDLPIGVSVPADASAPAAPNVGQLTLVYGGSLVRFNPVNRQALPVPLPTGARVLRVLPCYRSKVVQVRFPSGRLVAYAVPDAGGLVRLGEASAVVPDTGNRSVWLVTGSRVRQYGLDGGPGRRPIAVPTGYHAVSGIHGEVIAAGTGLDAHTILLPDRGHHRRVLAEGEALDAAASVVLLRQHGRLAVLDLRDGQLNILPWLSAVQITGPGTLAEDGAAFAVVGAVGGHERLEVGPIAPKSGAELQLVGLDGGTPLPHAPPPRWTDYGSVLAVRPDGRVVFYQPGHRRALVLDLGVPAVTAVGTG
jgi:hypothetical protein